MSYRRLCLILIGARQYQHELVSPESADTVTLSSVFAPQRDAFSQGRIAVSMAVAVIQQLKSVKIDHHYCGGFQIARVAQYAFESLGDPPPVQRGSESVERRESGRATPQVVSCEKTKRDAEERMDRDRRSEFTVSSKERVRKHSASKTKQAECDERHRQLRPNKPTEVQCHDGQLLHR